MDSIDGFAQYEWCAIFRGGGLGFCGFPVASFVPFDEECIDFGMEGFFGGAGVFALAAGSDECLQDTSTFDCKFEGFTWRQVFYDVELSGQERLVHVLIVVEDLEICKCEGENSCFGPEFVL